jgi:hypothetical protein
LRGGHRLSDAQADRQCQYRHNGGVAHSKGRVLFSGRCRWSGAWFSARFAMHSVDQFLRDLPLAGGDVPGQYLE